MMLIVSLLMSVVAHAGARGDLPRPTNLRTFFCEIQGMNEIVGTLHVPATDQEEAKLKVASLVLTVKNDILLLNSSIDGSSDIVKDVVH
jgi:hypothetical protein